MNRLSRDFSIKDFSLAQIKHWMLNWSQQFSIHLFLDSHSYRLTQGRYECLLATGAQLIIGSQFGSCLNDLASHHATCHDWLFGHLNYDYKNTLEKGLLTQNDRLFGFPDFHFFQPETVCFIDRDVKQLTIQSIHDPQVIFNQIINSPELPEVDQSVQFTLLTEKEKYIANVQLLRDHIAAGDCYEINYCIAGLSRNTIISPLQVYRKLCSLSPAPFAAYYRLDDLYALCSSPERYIMREGDMVVSQPIKGTSRRDTDPDIDRENANGLRHSIKEQAENVMIVDLVRNDLARNCKTGSINVDELFGIYSFPQVHQMISTISGQLKEGVSIASIIGSSFPMGSMTGAPKYKVMQLADKYEDTARELYSGTIGYVSPDGDFDFNVVIRSLFYNSKTGTLGYQAGGAITYDSDPGLEWDEVMLKAWAMEKVFSVATTNPL